MFTSPHPQRKKKKNQKNQGSEHKRILKQQRIQYSKAAKSKKCTLVLSHF